MSSTVGISIVNSIIAGTVADQRLDAGGITVDSNSKITGSNTGILIAASTFLGGINNAGTITSNQRLFLNSGTSAAEL